MDNPGNSAEVVSLYREFSDSFRANNDEAVRRIYRELLLLGRPRGEIVDAAMRLAGSNVGADLTLVNGVPQSRDAKPSIRFDRIAELRTGKEAVLDGGDNSSGVTLFPERFDKRMGQTVVESNAECAFEDIPDTAQQDGSCLTSLRERSRYTSLLLRSPMTRLCVALGAIALSLITGLVLPSTRSTAEKAVTLDDPSGARSAISLSVAAIPETTPAPLPLPPVTLPERERTVVPPTPAPPTRERSLSNGDVTVLLARGDSLFGSGDLTSARLFYERAANAGNGQAALRLGETYDPHFLDQARLRGARGDAAAAVFWYERARDLGMSEAEVLVGTLSSQ